MSEAAAAAPHTGTYWSRLAHNAGIPVILVDYQLTRRAKVHVLEWPEDVYPFSSVRLLECIEQAYSAGFPRVMLAYQQRDEHPACCYATLEPLKPEELDHG